MQTPSALQPDSTIHNRYRIVRIIGQGGMGAVYEAIDQRLGHTVALKQMMVSGAQYSIAFEREARLLAALRHPSLPKVTDFFVEGDQQFLVMEFIPGADLAVLRKERSQPFAIDEVLRWGDEILQALEFLHNQKPPIIHRDIKPQNLKVTPDGKIVLLDFGLAKGSAAAFSQVATTNSIFGYTPMYAPLEQIQGTGTTITSDLYSFSATLHHLLTDTPPVDVLARAGAILAGQPDPLRPAHQLNRQVPPAISEWLIHGLQVDANKRPASAAEMRAALHQIVQRPMMLPPTVAVSASQTPTVMTPAVQSPSLPHPSSQGYGYAGPITGRQPSQAPTRRSVMPWVVAGVGGGIVVLLLIALTVFLLLRPTTSSQALTSSMTAVVAPSASPQTEKDIAVVGAPTPVAEATTPPSPATSTLAPATATVAPTSGPQFGPLDIQRPVRVNASNSAPSGTDSSGSTITYGPENISDGVEDTTWRVPGDGVNQFVELNFAQPIRVREVLVLPGYAKTDPFDGTDRFKQNRRVRRVRLEFSDGSSVEAQFADARELQLATLPSPVVTTFVRIVILETTPPAAVEGRDFTPISEVVVRGEAQQ